MIEIRVYASYEEINFGSTNVQLLKEKVAAAISRDPDQVKFLIMGKVVEPVEGEWMGSPPPESVYFVDVIIFGAIVIQNVLSKILYENIHFEKRHEWGNSDRLSWINFIESSDKVCF